MTMAIMLRPWKTEHLEGVKNYFEIGIFHVCRAVYKKGIKCYPGEHEIEGPGRHLVTSYLIFLPADIYTHDHPTINTYFLK